MSKWRSKWTESEMIDWVAEKVGWDGKNKPILNGTKAFEASKSLKKRDQTENKRLKIIKFNHNAIEEVAVIFWALLQKDCRISGLLNVSGRSRANPKTVYIPME